MFFFRWSFNIVLAVCPLKCHRKIVGVFVRRAATSVTTH